MGVDSSMIIRNDFHDTGRAVERMAYIRKMEDKLLRRYAVKDREKVDN